MTASHIWIDKRIQIAAPDQFKLNLFDVHEPTFKQIHACSLLCNDAVFEESAENMALPVLQRACVGGNASDLGLLKFAEYTDGKVAQIRSSHKLCGEGTSYPARVPFNSKYKFAAGVFTKEGTYKPVLYIKGAPDQLIRRCSHLMIDGQKVTMGAAEKE